jgi:hypothetical protein
VIAERSRGMITILSALVSMLSCRFRSRASLEFKLVALRHQLIVLRPQRPRRLRLHSADRLLWVCLYRVWPRILDALGSGISGYFITSGPSYAVTTDASMCRAV